MNNHAFNPFRKFAAVVLAALALGISVAAQAVESEPFTQARFEQLQAEGAKILIDIGASWCPDCAKQQVVLTEYQAENPDSGIHILAVDFDTQKEWVTHFRAPRQSTLILFNGTEQVWFSVAETRKEQIFTALDSI
jgi:thiol-disulfide isomerase/thioredoxin